jgi:hypothetical protein
MTILHGAKYITDGDMSAAAGIFGPILNVPGLNQLSFTGRWTGAPVGAIRLFGTNDPRARLDSLRGLAGADYTADWHQLDLPTGAAKVIGSGHAVTTDEITTAAAVGTFTINIYDLFAFMQLRYVRTSGGSASSFQVRREGN